MKPSPFDVLRNEIQAIAEQSADLWAVTHSIDRAPADLDIGSCRLALARASQELTAVGLWLAASGPLTEPPEVPPGCPPLPLSEQ